MYANNVRTVCGNLGWDNFFATALSVANALSRDFLVKSIIEI
jgi:hypothetical protein